MGKFMVWNIQVDEKMGPQSIAPSIKNGDDHYFSDIQSAEIAG